MAQTNVTDLRRQGTASGLLGPVGFIVSGGWVGAHALGQRTATPRRGRGLAAAREGPHRCRGRQEWRDRRGGAEPHQYSRSGYGEHAHEAAPLDQIAQGED